MIRRDPAAARDGRFDLAVIGGGIYGVSLTLEAARRGLRPVLIERSDFGGKTTWNSLRILHGGQRYLQSMDLHRFRESVTERSRWLREFPDLALPLSCLMPLYGNGLRRPSVLRIALSLNDLLSRHRNEGLREDRRIGPGRMLGVSETLELFPDVDRQGLCGAAMWTDGAMPESYRVVVEMLHWANSTGAVCLNYVEPTRLLQAGGRAAGVAVRDAVSGEEFEIEASAVINCAGPWAPELAQRFDREIPGLFPLSIAFNLLLNRPPLSAAALAVAPREPGSRTYFLHPWKDRVLAGTYHAPWSGSTAEARIDETLVSRFLRDLNLAVPAWDLTPSDVERVHWGFLPARSNGGIDLAARETIQHHGPLGGVAGLFSVSGVKFTTARRVAEKTLLAVQRWRGGELPALAETPRPEPASWTVRDEIRTLLRDDLPEASDRIRSLIESEAVVHLDDLFLRRTDWGLDRSVTAELAEQVVGTLGWSEPRRRAELERLVDSDGSR